MIPSTKTIYDCLLDFKKESADKMVLLDEEKKYSITETLHLVNGIGNLLYKEGLRKGDSVALCATRSLNATLYLITLQCMGVRVYLIDPHDSVFDNKNVTAYITNEKNENPNKFNFYLNNKNVELEEVFSESADFDFISNSKDPTIVIYTSGSTGESKGVLLSQYAFINNAIDTGPIGDYSKDDIALCMIPIHHVFALALIMIAITLHHSVFFPKDVEIEHLAYCIDKYKLTRVNGVPSLYKAIMDLKVKHH